MGLFLFPTRKSRTGLLTISHFVQSCLAGVVVILGGLSLGGHFVVILFQLFLDLLRENVWSCDPGFGPFSGLRMG